ncbi:CapA family protein [Oceanobacillus senegalensis]|uniref:CapA family protein n=1 Tax=Oceanobacillus senegalensis TaxID=1936063 RepID=UPI001FECE87D|nr:CapA family protein [Oceanobacillus senegalensis]
MELVKLAIQTLPFILCFSFILSQQPIEHPYLNSAQPFFVPAILEEDSVMRSEFPRYILEMIDYEKSLTISAAGDVTIGSDDSFGYHGTFHHEVEEQGLEHFGKNVKSIFEEDDLTIVNLETTLTNSKEKADKLFRFSGKPSYTEVLNLSSIEAVNLANNHTFDFLQRGYEDTIENLNKHHISSFGYDRLFLEEVNGIKVGAIGYKGWSDTAEVREGIKRDIEKLRDNGAQIIIANFHWGDERHYHPNAVQQSLGRYAIDVGADLVLGHHPHVVQGIEEYKDKFIVYSLGNFMFGGNRNPDDKDTFIFQQTFHFTFNELNNKQDIKIIPTRISSLDNRNNYQPTPLEGEEATRVLDKILSLSNKITDNEFATDTYHLEENIAVFSNVVSSKPW